MSWTSHDDEETRTLAAAYRREWDGSLRPGALTRHNLHDAERLIAKRILELASTTQKRDEWRLARAALAVIGTTDASRSR